MTDSPGSSGRVSSAHSCDNCEGIDPDSCLFAPGRGLSARARYEDVSSRGEAALLSGLMEKREAWFAALTAAEREVYAARFGPSWASLLADPFSQIEGAGEVTASILAYQNAALASGCACGGTIHSGCKP